MPELVAGTGTGSGFKMPRFDFVSTRVSLLRLVLIGSACWLGGCGGGSGTVAPPVVTTTGSVAQKYADYFPIGTAVSAWHLDNAADTLTRDFNHLTCENAMKAQNIHPTETSYDWAEADRIADFARSHGMKMTGHALLWHRQAPAWLFAGITAGDPTSLELLKSRLKAHIEAVINRYADVVDNWDVVNEAISSDPNKVYRDASEQSQWYELFGSEEYIYWAFSYAQGALEAIAPGSSLGKLYYNDYLVTVKVDKILAMFTWLESRGIHVDGIGFQSHENMSWPSAGELESAFKQFAEAGYAIKVSELDVTVYDDSALPEVPYTAELEAAQAERFAALFAAYRATKAISSVTFWGIADDRSWLNYVPVPGRHDYPLLYKDAHTPKKARSAIMDF